MDGANAAGAAATTLEAKGVETEPIGTGGEGVVAGGVARGKPVGAVVAAANVLRTLHASERPLNASEVARATGLHRGTAYNILRTLQAEGFVGYERRRGPIPSACTFSNSRMASCGAAGSWTWRGR
jgi:hypothetical protein